MVLQRDSYDYIRGRRIGQRQIRDHLRVTDRNIRRVPQRYILPDADVSISDAGHPIPTFGRDERGSIKCQLSAVRPHARGERLFVRDARIGWWHDMHDECVFPV